MAVQAQIKIHRTIIHKARGCMATACKAMFNVDPSDEDSTFILEVTHNADVDLIITEMPKGKGAVMQKHTVPPGKSYRVNLPPGTTFESMSKHIGTWTYLFSDSRPFTVNESTTRMQEGEEEARRN